MTESKKVLSKPAAILKRIPLPTLIIAGLWIIVLILGTTRGQSLITLISDTIRRFGMWGLLVLAMVPSIQSGTGPNFALPIGIVCGLLAVVCSIELGLTGITWLLMAVVLAIAFATILGFLYGKLMNAVKGSEMTIATYSGFSITYFFCILWMALPFKSPIMGWMLGSGLRNTLELKQLGAAHIVNNFLGFEFVKVSIPNPNAPEGVARIVKTLFNPNLSASSTFLNDMDATVISRFVFPTGMFLVLAVACLLMWMFFRSKSGIAISAVGMNPMFARASGLNVNRSRVTANILSTILTAVGIIIYSQSFGYAQLYDAPLMMSFQAVACILIGGATAQRASIFHVIIGTIIFQGLLTNGPPVLNNLFPDTDLSEIIRMIVQNGIILYALTLVKGGDEQ